MYIMHVLRTKMNCIRIWCVPRIRKQCPARTFHERLCVCLCVTVSYPDGQVVQGCVEGERFRVQLPQRFLQEFPHKHSWSSRGCLRHGSGGRLTYLCATGVYTDKLKMKNHFSSDVHFCFNSILIRFNNNPSVIIVCSAFMTLRKSP